MGAIGRAGTEGVSLNEEAHFALRQKLIEFVEYTHLNYVTCLKGAESFSERVC